jgi:hypothetical protein
MAFDCICIDFKNNKSEQNIENIKKIFPYVRVISFIDSYFEIIKSYIPHSKTEYLWVLSSLIDYNKFDFNFIPEQFQEKQIHVWNFFEQKEGDTFLIPKYFLQQDIKFLRDYKDINYHETDILNYDFDFEECVYDLSDNIDNLKGKKSNPENKYIKYREKDKNDNNKKIYPSYWEDLKIYRDNNLFYIPSRAFLYIQTQIYDYPLILNINTQYKKDCFDICFISNGEPFELENYNILFDHIKKNNLKNQLHWIKNIPGRTQAYKQAALQSNTEYFYAVFAKSIVEESFMFDFTIDRAKNKRHYIFHARLKEIELEYGTFNINLYSKTLTSNTPDDPGLDFTLYSQHEVIPIVSNTALLCPDNYTAWKNAFREVTKLIFWNHKRPTVETTFRIKKWLSTNNKWLAKGASDAKDFIESIEYSNELIKQTYTWEFVRNKFKTLYPAEQYY